MNIEIIINNKTRNSGTSYYSKFLEIENTSLLQLFFLKGRMQCFSMQVVINKCFLLNPEKKRGSKLIQDQRVLDQANY